MARIVHRQHALTPAEQRVAQLVLAHPRLALSGPTGDIARHAAVRQPTAIRFCRSLGVLGLADFQLKFASSLSGALPVRRSQVQGGDSAHELGAKVIDNTVAAILTFRDQLDAPALERPIGWLAKARRIELYALGGAGAVARDGQRKCVRLRIPSAAYGDAEPIAHAAGLLRPGGVVLAIARAAGAEVSAICNGQSALAKQASVCLAVNHAQDGDAFLSMVARILQSLLVDIPSVGLALGARTGRGGGRAR